MNLDFFFLELSLQEGIQIFIYLLLLLFFFIFFFFKNTTVWGPILGTFKHLSMYCDSLYISRQNVPVHSCYIFSALCSIKHFRISCRFRCFTADFRSTAARHAILGSCDPIIGPVAGAHAISKGCACTPRMIDARTELY